MQEYRKWHKRNYTPLKLSKAPWSHFVRLAGRRGNHRLVLVSWEYPVQSCREFTRVGYSMRRQLSVENSFATLEQEFGIQHELSS